MNFNYLILPHSLYIHWPFCPYKCHFCDFVALAAHDAFMEQYHQALCIELETFFAHYSEQLKIDTIYLGGGTPSTYPDHLLLDMFGILRKHTQISALAEVTIEVNPGTVRKEQLELWKNLGINRISMGVQSLNDFVLKKLNRHQSKQDVVSSLKDISSYFDNISIDLILGLPGIGTSEWKEILAEVSTWPINHIAIYFLTVHENTPLYYGIKKNTVTLPPDDETVDTYYWSIEFLKQYGFEQYEISNFARNGFYSRHNTVYWQRKPFKGFGLGAWSYDGQCRYSNEKNLKNYLEGVQSKKDITIVQEKLSPEQRFMEKIMLGLRQRKGLTINEILEGLTPEKQIILRKNIDFLVTHGLINNTKERLSITPEALALENEIILKFTI